MKCQKCGIDLPEPKIQESHDVPCYLFFGNRNQRKQLADKYPRHWLCKECHEKYEKKLNNLFIQTSLNYSKEFFNG